MSELWAFINMSFHIFSFNGKSLRQFRVSSNLSAHNLSCNDTVVGSKKLQQDNVSFINCARLCAFTCIHFNFIKGKNYDYHSVRSLTCEQSHQHKKSFQCDAYSPLAHHMCFNNQTPVNKFEQASSLGHQIPLVGGGAGGVHGEV